MSPKSPGRKKKSKDTRPQHPPGPDVPSQRSAAAEMVREVCRQLRHDVDALRAEVLVSELLSIEVLGPLDEDMPLGDTDDDVVAAVIAEAAAHRTPESLGLLRCIASLGNHHGRVLAAAAAAALDQSGVPAPSWAEHLAAVTPTGAWAQRDVYGDETTVVLSFTRTGRDHAIAVLVDHAAGGMARDALVDEEPAQLIAELRDESSSPLVVMERLDLGEARGMLEAAMAATDAGPLATLDEDLVTLDEPLVTFDEDYDILRTLVAARLRCLPEPTRPAAQPKPVDESQRAAIIAEFLDSTDAATVADRPEARRCARLILDHGCDIDPGRPLRVGPATLAHFLLNWLPDVAEVDEATDGMPFEESIDGINPRLHIAIHEMAATQLWDDDPPEAWQASQRLLATGMERHDVLHALAGVATAHLWQALQGKRPADIEAYRHGLDDLAAPPAGRSRHIGSRVPTGQKPLFEAAEPAPPRPTSAAFAEQARRRACKVAAGRASVAVAANIRCAAR